MSKNIFSIALALWIIFPVASYGQQNSDPEAEFQRIRTSAFNGNYSEAAADARKLVNAFPEYGDARILLGRILAWQKKYDEAILVIDTLLLREPGNSDAISARKDISLWRKENTPVKTEIRGGYYFDNFKLPYNRFWQVFNAAATHKFNWGKASAGLNIGNLFEGSPLKMTGTNLQAGVEAWPRITSKNYAYLAYAYSPGDYFPGHRASLEVWQVLPAGWSVAGGFNYFYFNNNIFYGLVSVEKYLGKFWLSGTEYVFFKEFGLSTSFYLNVRRYFGDRDFLQGTFGYGAAPDEPYDIQVAVNRLSAYSARLTYNRSIGARYSVRIGAGYSREEYSENLWRNRFEGGISLTYALKMK